MPEAIPKFQYRELAPGGLLLACTGGLSWEDRGLLADEVARYVAGRGGTRFVVLDMSGVTFVNSAGLGALFQLCARLRQHGVRLQLAHVPPVVLRMFYAVGLDRLAGIASDVAEAVRRGEAAEPEPEPERDPILDPPST
jgi:anti-anti-sigma factor